MGRQQDAAFYNNRMQLLGKPLHESPWRDLYIKVVSLLPGHEPILDIGCGTGRMAEAARLVGLPSYRGIDFSPVRVEEARRYVPTFQFDVMDALSEEAFTLYKQYRAFAITEVLEHIEGDLALLEALPSGASVVFSVPNYDSEGHVRHFASAQEAAARYSAFISIDLHDEVKRTHGDHRIFLFRGTRAPA